MSVFNDFQDKQFESDFPFGIPCDTWITKDNGAIKLSAMTETHIKNCMKLVGKDSEWYTRFERELRKRKFKQEAHHE